MIRGDADPLFPDEAGALRAVLDNLAEGVIVANEHGRLTFFNPEAARILGLGANDIHSSAWSSACGWYFLDQVTPFPPEQLPLTRALRGEEVLHQLIFIRNQGQSRGLWVSVSSRPLRNGTGIARGALVAFRDVTARQNALRKITLETLGALGSEVSFSEAPPGMECEGCLERCTRFRDCFERVSRAVEQTADTVVITDRKGIIEYVNPAFEQTTGYTRSEALGRTPRLLKSGYHDKDFYARLWDELVAGRPYRGTIVNRKKSGEFYWAEQTITPITDDRGEITHFVSVLKDMTERRKMERQQFFLDLAREVQKRFYAQRESVPGFDIAAAAFPVEQTGGDYFDFLPQPDGCLDMVIGDVSGHGFGAALVMAETRAYVRSYSSLHLPVNALLDRMNRVLAGDLEGRHSVTLVLARLDPHARTLEYVNAGHVSGYILNASGELAHLLESTGPPLGMFADVAYPRGSLIALEQGDVLALITDGVTEAMSKSNDQFGAARVVRFLQTHLGEPAAQLVDGLHDAAEAFSSDSMQQDDITSLICKVGEARGAADCRS